MPTPILQALLADRRPEHRRQNWRDAAACRGRDLEAFFPLGDERRTTPDHAESAKQICRACPVQLPCLTWALAVPELYGIWGGASPAERRALRERRVLRE